MITVNNVTVRFAAHEALSAVSLEVEGGQCRAVIGPNGAGKSTLFAVLGGERRPSSGTFAIDGQIVRRASPSRLARAGVVRTFQICRVIPTMTVLENAALAVLANGSARRRLLRPPPRGTREAAAEILERVNLTEQRDELAANLAQGDKKRLELATALALSPRVLLLDEPTAGMSPEESAATTALVHRLWRETGMTVLLTEHDMKVVFGLAEEVTVLHQGRVICTGTPSEVSLRDDVKRIYLGDE